MSSLVRHITFDGHDPYTLGSFWAQAVGGRLQDDDRPGDPAALVTTDEGLALLFEVNPDDKSVKNRVHLDLQPRERTRDEEVTWLGSIGATVYNDQRRPDGSGWVVMQDPEGNEFCVERSPAERA
ncbi:MAG TPA: VOC family protein [Kribbella sp.]|nr:VOC family protein [Kribbella sp.]